MIHEPRDDLQKKAINFLYQIKKDEDEFQRFLSLNTGSGKTYVTINLISKLKKRAFIIVDTLDLAEQWKREFLNHTNLKETDISILSGQEKVESEKKKNTAQIYIAIHKTLGNIISSDMNGINSLMNSLGIGIRIFDEAHVDFGNICNINALSNVEYTFYLTATPSRSNFNDNSLYAKVFSSIPYFNGKELSERKYHTVVLFKMNSKPGIDDEIFVKTKYGFSQSRWASYLLNNSYTEFLEAVNSIFTRLQLNTRKKKIAIMLPTIELIKKLKDDLPTIAPDKSIGLFIGEIAKNKRFDELKKDIILTNDKIFDKGIDVKDLEILINFVPLGSLVKTEQIMGRLRDREGYSSILIDVTDIGFNSCVQQSKIRKRFYKKKAKKIIELN